MVGDSSDDGDGAGQLRASQQSQTRVPIVHAMKAVPVQQLVRPLPVVKQAEPVELKKLEEVEEFQHAHGLSIDSSWEEESTAASCESTVCSYCRVTRQIATGLQAKIADLETRLQEFTSDSISTQIDARLEDLVAVQIATAVAAAEVRIAETWQANLDRIETDAKTYVQNFALSALAGTVDELKAAADEQVNRVAAEAADAAKQQVDIHLETIEDRTARAADDATEQLRVAIEDQRQALAEEVDARKQADVETSDKFRKVNKRMWLEEKVRGRAVRGANARINE